MIPARTSLRPPMALVLRAGALSPGLSALTRIEIKGLSIPSETSPNTMDRMLKNMYRTIFPLYLDRYWRITENFFMLKSVNLETNLAVIISNYLLSHRTLKKYARR